MKKIFIIIVLPLTILFSSTVTLDEIIANAKPSLLIKESLKEEAMALQNQNLASTQENPLTLNHSISRNNGKVVSGYEHEIGFSKELILGNIQSLEQQQNQLNNEAYLVEEKLSIIEIENHLKNLYHQRCLDNDYLANFKKVYEKLSELYRKKEIAFAQGEIAKTEILQLELEKNRLGIELKSMIAKEKASTELLLSLTNLTQVDSFSCQDIYPIVAQINISQQTFSLSQKAYEKRIKSTQTGLKRYNHKIESVELSVGYTKEIENEIYTIGVSVPLNFSSKKSEYAKSSLMHQSSALELKHSQQISQKSYEVRRLYERLRQDFLMIQAQEQNIDNYTNNLLPLMKKSYDYGESSVIEYLLSQQRLYALEQELLKQKKDYYQTLFEFYTVSEIKDKQ